jgi:N utilization substance protein B
MSKKHNRYISAREIAMQLLFQLEQQGLCRPSLAEKPAGGIKNWSASEITALFLRENAEDDMTSRLAKNWLDGTIEKIEQCDELLQSVLVHWSVQKVMPLERAILRICTYQMAFCNEIPMKVAINEGVEMAKKFGSANSSRFVNGILDAVYRKLSTAEAAPEEPPAPEQAPAEEK